MQRENRAAITTLSIVLIVLLLIVGIGSAVYITTLNNKISSQNDSITTLQQNVAHDQSVIGEQTTMINSQNITIIKLQDNVTHYQETLVTLNGSLNADKATIQNLSTLITTDGSQISSLQNQTTNLNNQLTNDHQLLTENVSHSLVNSQTFQQAAGGCSDVISFSSTYSGYVIINFSSTSSSAFIAVSNTVTCNNGNGPSTFMFPTTTSGVYDFPFMAGTVHIGVGNLDTASVSTTVSVIEFT